jgi:glucosyl-3-phosphoglycerate synthase
MTAARPVPAPGPLTASATAFEPGALAARKQGVGVTLCLPARDEEPTVGAIVAAVDRDLRRRHGLVDDILVVDDGSADATAAVALQAGARVVEGPRLGKGEAMHAGLAAAQGDLVVFCDADVRRFRPAFVTGLLGPLLLGDASFVKGYYERPLDGRAGEGGRVTELVAKPLLRTLFPALAGFLQPLAGECAARRDVLEAVPFVGGYGVDIGLLIDVAALIGVGAMGQVDLGRRHHRNRPLTELAPQAEIILRTVLARAGLAESVPECPALASRAQGDRKSA